MPRSASFILVASTLLALYLGLHLYLFRCVRSQANLHGRTVVLLAIVIALLGLSVFLSLATHRLGWPGGMRFFFGLWSLWLGPAFYLALCNLLVGGANRLSAGIAVLSRQRLIVPTVPRSGWTLLALVTVTGLVCIYGFYAANSIRVRSVAIETDRLPPGVEGLRILQISDLHLGSLMSGRRLDRVLSIARHEKADIVVSTGDLVDGEPSSYEKAVQQLKELQAPLGKFAILGNHEFFLGADKATSILRSMGFAVLRNQSATPGDAVALVGIDDPHASRSHPASTGDSAEPALKTPAGLFTIALYHPPANPHGGSTWTGDLQLSGHTHGGGQLWPLRYIARTFFPILSGMRSLPGGGLLIVSSGAGTWGPPYRVLCPPEVVVVELVRARGNPK